MSDAPADRRIDRPSAATVLLAAASVMAGLIHAAVTPEHLVEAWVFGAFFALAAGFQLGWAIAVIVRPSPGVYATGALANMALIAIWLASRTTGLPVGPEPWAAEAVGLADVSATMLEAIMVAGLLFRMTDSERSSHHGRLDASHEVATDDP